MLERRFLLFVALSALGSGAWAARPVALIFELGQNKSAPVVQKVGPASATEAEPQGIGARAIRKAFQDKA